VRSDSRAGRGALRAARGRAVGPPPRRSRRAHRLDRRARLADQGRPRHLRRRRGADFDAAARALTDRLAIHQPENWSPTPASFTAPSEDGIEVGVQLVPAGSRDERLFIGWRDRLRADPELRTHYDELKRRHSGDGIDAYRDAKERLTEESAAEKDHERHARCSRKA
jgi:GrpB-like predicted nucleotidyltransferase (UPF0157 family)